MKQHVENPSEVVLSENCRGCVHLWTKQTGEVVRAGCSMASTLSETQALLKSASEGCGYEMPGSEFSDVQFAVPAFKH